MALTKSQEAIFQKARALGGGDQAVALTDEMCNYLLARVAVDLDRSAEFSGIPSDLPPLFSDCPAADLVLSGFDTKEFFTRLVAAIPDADTYFACLASLQKARLKYERILSVQPIPTLEQVGPRALLQFGQLSSQALVSLLFWRKWFYDLDNRAGQETGYLFEPLIAYAIGGTPVPASKSPVKRRRDRSKGRQVDCILDKRAYELKIRVTIAASGQGRWKEELDFPSDCRRSGYTPILVCMDGTRNPKLNELETRFRKEKGEVYIGDDAWTHLESQAGDTLARFLERYVRGPIQSLLTHGDEPLLEFSAKSLPDEIQIVIGQDLLRIPRKGEMATDGGGDEMPPDADDTVPGV